MIRFQIIVTMNGRREYIHCETLQATKEVRKLLNAAGHEARAWNGLNEVPDDSHKVILPPNPE